MGHPKDFEQTGPIHPRRFLLQRRHASQHQEMMQDRVERTWNKARATLAELKGETE